MGASGPPRPCGFVSQQNIRRMLTHSWGDQRGAGARRGDRPVAVETAARLPTPSVAEWVCGEGSRHPDRGVTGGTGTWEPRAGSEGREGPPAGARGGRSSHPAFSSGGCSSVVRAVGMFWRGTVLMVA